jgi:hypothetical protein
VEPEHPCFSGGGGRDHELEQMRRLASVCGMRLAGVLDAVLRDAAGDQGREREERKQQQVWAGETEQHCREDELDDDEDRLEMRLDRRPEDVGVAAQQLQSVGVVGALVRRDRRSALGERGELLFELDQVQVGELEVEEMREVLEHQVHDHRRGGEDAVEDGRQRGVGDNRVDRLLERERPERRRDRGPRQGARPPRPRAAHRSATPPPARAEHSASTPSPCCLFGRVAETRCLKREQLGVAAARRDELRV